MYIDSHAHIFSKEFKGDLNEVLQRAVDAGIDMIVVPGTNLETSREAVELSAKHRQVYACVGYHPHDASDASDAALVEIETLSLEEKVVGIGEIGLDFHYDFSPRDRQISVFEAQVKLAVSRQLPVVVHTRESVGEAIDVLTRIVAQNTSWRGNGASALSRGRGVFHCYTGDVPQARNLFAMGFRVSYPGIVTFKNSPVVRTLQEIGLDHALLETDSPYLAPVPNRGKRNEPSYIGLIAEKIAEILRISPEAVGKKTSENTRVLFDLQE